MAGIVPPFRFKLWMGEMVLGKGEGPARKGASEVLGEKGGGYQMKKDKEDSNNGEGIAFDFVKSIDCLRRKPQVLPWKTITHLEPLLRFFVASLLRMTSPLFIGIVFLSS